MGKSKLISVTVHKVYKDETLSSRIDIIHLGVYRSFNKRLIDNIDRAIFHLLRNEDDTLDIISEDKNSWKNFYSRIVDYFDNDDNGTSSITVSNTKKFKEVFIQIAIINLDDCENNILSYWLNTPKINKDTENEEKYKFPKVKPNITHYTN